MELGRESVGGIVGSVESVPSNTIRVIARNIPWDTFSGLLRDDFISQISTAFSEVAGKSMLMIVNNFTDNSLPV